MIVIKMMMIMMMIVSELSSTTVVPGPDRRDSSARDIPQKKVHAGLACDADSLVRFAALGTVF